MNPKYSILLCNQSIAEYEDKIKNWLFQGIKIFWFGKESDISQLKEKYPDFFKAFLLQGFTVKTQ